MAEPTSIAFSQVPGDLEVPGSYLEFNGDNASNGAAPIPYIYLILGQMLSTGTAQPLVPGANADDHAAEHDLGSLRHRGELGALVRGQGLEHPGVPRERVARHVEAEHFFLLGETLDVGHLGHVGQTAERGRVAVCA